MVRATGVTPQSENKIHITAAAMKLTFQFQKMQKYVLCREVEIFEYFVNLREGGVVEIVFKSCENVSHKIKAR